MTAYDPDLCPTTVMLASEHFHARCRTSKVSWVVRADIPSPPRSPRPSRATRTRRQSSCGRFARWCCTTPTRSWTRSRDTRPGTPGRRRARRRSGGRLGVRRHPRRRHPRLAPALLARRAGDVVPARTRLRPPRRARRSTAGRSPSSPTPTGPGSRCGSLPKMDGSREHSWLGRVDPPSGRVQVARRNCRVLLIAGPDREPESWDDEDVRTATWRSGPTVSWTTSTISWRPARCWSASPASCPPPRRPRPDPPVRGREPRTPGLTSLVITRPVRACASTWSRWQSRAAPPRTWPAASSLGGPVTVARPDGATRGPVGAEGPARRAWWPGLTREAQSPVARPHRLTGRCPVRQAMRASDASRFPGEPRRNASCPGDSWSSSSGSLQQDLSIARSGLQKPRPVGSKPGSS